MPYTVNRLALGRGVFSVNCYLIKVDGGFVLVDTGTRGKRAELIRSLRALGCEPDLLRLILITHGDFDHIGSAAYLRKTFGAPIAMHENDVEMSANGDMFAGRNRPSWPVRTLTSLTLRLSEEDRFTPDVLVDEGSDFSRYGLAGAQVVLLCGHSAGSIALLLADGSLLCGDVLENRKTPRLGSIMDDPLAAKTSVERLGTMMISTVYPGHGSPFEFREITAAHP